MTSVVLRPGYTWDCERCGRENFHRGLVVERSGEEMAQLRRELGVDSVDVGVFLAMPELVQCGHCQATFEVTHFKDG